MTIQFKTRNALLITLATASMLAPVALPSVAIAQEQDINIAQPMGNNVIDVIGRNGLADAIARATATLEDPSVGTVTITIRNGQPQQLPDSIKANGKIVIVGMDVPAGADGADNVARPLLTLTGERTVHVESPLEIRGVRINMQSTAFNADSDLKIANSYIYNSTTDPIAAVMVNDSSSHKNNTIDIEQSTFFASRILYMDGPIKNIRIVKNRFEGNVISTNDTTISLGSTQSDPGQVVIEGNSFQVRNSHMNAQNILVSRPNVGIYRNEFMASNPGQHFSAIKINNVANKNPINNVNIVLNQIFTSYGVLSAGDDQPLMPGALKINFNSFERSKTILPITLPNSTKDHTTVDARMNVWPAGFAPESVYAKVTEPITKEAFNKASEGKELPKIPAPQLPPAQPLPQPNPSPSNPIAPAGSRNLIRISGETRYETSVAASRQAFANGAQAVVLARGDIAADSVSAAPLATAANAPVLLSQPDVLHPVTAAEITRLKAKTVYMMGGHAALSQAVEDAVAKLGVKVVRIDGANRAATAVHTAEHLAKMGKATQVLVADGADWQTSLIAAPAAAAVSGITLLSNGATMAPETKAFLDAHTTLKVTAIGDQAITATPRSTMKIAGRNAEQLGVDVAKHFFTKPKAFGVATTADFADALTGGAHIAGVGGPLLLSARETAKTVIDWSKGQADVGNVFVYGGTTRITDAQAEAFIK
ncbi:cell wall-binding repeat-containing protein [Stomatohabitans albus]|uniref:cell wall-binding repeat-containing protein n=1 Tax=Stomatohabitans albus TaxID=3110766 RepID=UPI00300C4693